MSNQDLHDMLRQLYPPRRSRINRLITHLLASVVFTLLAGFGVWMISASLNLGWSYWSDCVLFGMGATTVISSTLEYRRIVTDE